MQTSWTGLICAFTNTTVPPPLTAKQRVVIILDQPVEGVDGYGRKDFEKRSFKTRVEWKTPQERPTSSPGSEREDGEELCDNEGLN